jgi:hypothetical protein
MKNIKIIRLQTGEDIIGEVNDSEGIVSITKPFTIIPMQSQPGKPVQLILTPWMPYTDDKSLTIDESKVVTIANPKEDILKSYEQNTSSLITKPSGLITETNLPKL